MLKLVKYLVSYFFLKKRLKNVFKPYLLESGTVTTSIIRKRIVLKDYSSQAIKGVTTILDYLNSSYPFFKIDKIVYTPFKIILSQSPLTEKFVLPESYIPKPDMIPFGCDENKNILHLNTKTTSSTGIFLPSGSGKTHFLMQVLKAIRKHNYCGFKIVVWDPKLDSDYDFLEADNFKILRSLDEALQFHRELKEAVENGNNSKWLILAEEYLQWTDSSKFKNSKDRKEMSQELLANLETAMQLYRSKGIHTILVSQNPNSSAQTVDINNVANKIYGYITPAQAQTLNIQEILQSRSDFTRGKFIVSISHRPFVLFRGVEND